MGSVAVSASLWRFDAIGSPQHAVPPARCALCVPPAPVLFHLGWCLSCCPSLHVPIRMWTRLIVRRSIFVSTPDMEKDNLLAVDQGLSRRIVRSHPSSHSRPALSGRDLRVPHSRQLLRLPQPLDVSASGVFEESWRGRSRPAKGSDCGSTAGLPPAGTTSRASPLDAVYHVVVGIARPSPKMGSDSKGRPVSRVVAIQAAPSFTCCRPAE